MELFHDGRTGWRKARSRMVRQYGVNILAKLWVRSKWLREFRTSYLQWSMPTPTRKSRSLCDGEIRLLQIKPGLSLSIIDCSFSYVELHSSGDYAALSYTWGVFDPSIPILIDGKVTMISENLYLAMLHLRKRGTKTLWVDALCINQTDLDERARQVNQMKDVYQKAHIVLIWLGESNQLTELAFNELHGLTELLDYDEAVPELFFDRQVMNKYHQRWRAISEILYRPWFQRMWVIQEVLSARKGMMICGRDALDLHLFLKLVNSMWRANVLKHVMSYHPQRHELSDGPMRIVAEQLTFLVKAKFEHTNYLMQSKFNPTLLNYLAETRWAEATDPRDKVYALLSLVGGSRELGHWYEKTIKSRIWVPFKVDYNPQCKQEYVFINVTKAIISTSKSLDVLKFAGQNSHGVTGLPSWVPDWASKKPSQVHGHSSLDSMHGREESQRGTVNSSRYNEGDQKQLHDKITACCSAYFKFGPADMLTIRGIHFDTIRALTDDPYPEERSQYSIDPQLEEAPEWIEVMQTHIGKFTQWLEEAVYLASSCSPYPTGQPTQQSFWNILNAGIAEEEKRVPENLSFESLLNNLENCKSTFSTFKKKMLSLLIPPQDAIADFIATTAWSRVERCLEQLPKTNSRCYSQKFATTQNGYFGFVPNGTRVDDLVCIVYGCESSFIIRKVGRKNYQLIGRGIFEGFDFDDTVVERWFMSNRNWREPKDQSFFVTRNRRRQEVYTILRKTENFRIV